MKMKARAKFQRIFRDKDPKYLPRTLWKHHPTDEKTEDFVKATLDFHSLHTFDILKITPNSSFCVQDYGCEIASYGPLYGNVIYRAAFHDVGKWNELQPLDPAQKTLGLHVESAKAISKKIGPAQLVLQTIFSPLAQAINLIGLDALLCQIECSPSHVWKVINILAATTKNFIQAIASYVDGFCYAIQESSHLARFPPSFIDQYHPMNIELLGSYPELIKMMHLHGRIHEFSRFCQYPLDILHWDEEASGVSLPHGKTLFPGVVSGGIRWPEDGWKHSEEVVMACQAARKRIGAERFLLAPACVIPYKTPIEFTKTFANA
jgi:uroporphyrinogen decarboxylase